ncbi:Cytoplasmic dynein 1 intermediate chain [Diplonema papillatum]|nr:Cytoplasmic dynein 1 intermediate chain [Diplonema papillatum]
MSEGSSVRDELAEKRRRLAEMRTARKLGTRVSGSPGTSSASPTRSSAASPTPGASSQPSAASAAPSIVKTSAEILGGAGAATRKEGDRILPKPVNLKLAFPSQLSWSVAPQGRPDNYTKSAQTMHSGPIEASETVSSPASPVVSPHDRRRSRSMVALETSAKKSTEEEEELEPAEQLSTQQKFDIVKSGDFKDFFSSASFMVERALSNIDILPPGMSDASETVLVRVGEPLIRTQVFNDSQLTKKITKGCPITSVEFNTYVTGPQEMFLASYFRRAEGQTTLVDVEGQVLIWSIRVPQRPFQVLNAPSDVAKAMYCKFKSNLVVGGLYNGQVCLWDTRVGSDPVQVTPLTLDGHTHPVFGMDVVGSVNSHSLVTLSSDGKVCSWQLEKMSTPAETHVLQQMVDVGGTAVAKEIQATSLAFRDNESNRFYLGSENGMLLSGTRSSGTPNPDGYEGHTSPITSLHCHPASPPGAEDYTDFVLTSSMDWTCKLWHPSKSDKPIFSFDEYTDYVYDVRWSPVHPAVFASVDGSGTLSVWNLLESMETPIGKVESSPNGRASCHLSWSGDGRCIIVGDAGGDCTLWEVNGAEASAKAADWPLLGQKLAEINAV